MKAAFFTDGKTSTPWAFDMSSLEPFTVAANRDNVPSTAELISCRFAASVSGLLPLPDVAVQPVKAKLAAAVEIAICCIKFRLFIIDLHCGYGADRQPPIFGRFGPLPNRNPPVARNSARR